MRKTKKSISQLPKQEHTFSGRAKANRREIRSCLGQVFNFKLGGICYKCYCMAWTSPHSELKTWPLALLAQVEPPLAQSGYLPIYILDLGETVS